MGKRAKIKTSVTIDPDLYEYAKAEAERLGISDLSTFIRMLIAAHKNKSATERRNNAKNTSPR